MTRAGVTACVVYECSVVRFSREVADTFKHKAAIHTQTDILQHWKHDLLRRLPWLNLALYLLAQLGVWYGNNDPITTIRRRGRMHSEGE